MPTQMAARESETGSKPGDTDKKKLFLSYNFKDEPFVRRVNYHLLTQHSVEPYCWAEAEPLPQETDTQPREAAS